MICFTIGGLSMIGLPPTCGFFSKWYLISGGIEAGQWKFVAALLFSSLINAVIFFKIFERAYFSKIKGVKEESTIPDRDTIPVGGVKSVTTSMLVPLFIGSLLVLIIGIMNQDLFSWISNALKMING